jgi:FMN phosphatase YigB (HAD superfamily)
MAALVFLVDVDNTLLDNDRVKAGMESGIQELAGKAGARDFWSVYEDVRKELDYVDVPLTLARFRARRPDVRRFPQISALLLGYPFEKDLYPKAMAVVGHMKKMGTVVVLSDGDPVFQPAKIGRLGLADAVDSNVLIYAHKERHLDEVRDLYPARHYVLVDDKPAILARAKRQMNGRLTTVHVQQGKYASAARTRPQPDISLAAIGDLLRVGEPDLLPPRRPPRG